MRFCYEGNVIPLLISIHCSFREQEEVSGKTQAPGALPMRREPSVPIKFEAGCRIFSHLYKVTLICVSGPTEAQSPTELLPHGYTFIGKSVHWFELITDTAGTFLTSIEISCLILARKATFSMGLKLPYCLCASLHIGSLDLLLLKVVLFSSPSLQWMVRHISQQLW
jgi:hypothetical protein